MNYIKVLSIMILTTSLILNAKEQTILVTGGAGYIGSHTSFYLKEKGYNIIILDNMYNSYDFPYEWATLIKGDCGDKKLLDTIFTQYNVNAVMHFAAFANVRESVSDPLSYYENNVIQTTRLLESMIEHDIKQFIFSSTCATYGMPETQPITEATPQKPINPYGMTKLMIEHILKDLDAAHGMKYICLRYFNVAGALPSQCLGEKHATHLIPILLDSARSQGSFSYWGGDYPTPDGTCVRDYIHVMDLADAHWRALDYLETNQKSNAFNLGSGDGFSVKEVVEAVKKITGLPFDVITEQRKPGEPPILTADAKKAHDILGWQPQYNLDDMIADAYEYALMQAAMCTVR